MLLFALPEDFAAVPVVSGDIFKVGFNRRWVLTLNFRVLLWIFCSKKMETPFFNIPRPIWSKCPRVYLSSGGRLELLLVSEEFRKQRQLCLSAGAGFSPRWEAWDSIPTDTVSIWIICSPCLSEFWKMWSKYLCRRATRIACDCRMILWKTLSVACILFEPRWRLCPLGQGVEAGLV